MQKTDIEYLTHTWNPIAMLCSPVSAGCDNCWHRNMARRMSGMKQFSQERRDAYAGGKPVLIESELAAPGKVKKSSVIGVQFMGDLHHDNVTGMMLFEIYRTIIKNQNHKFLVLTKRPDNLKDYAEIMNDRFHSFNKPLPNLWLGVSISTNDDLWMVEKLLQIPAAVRFVSVEPMLERIDFEQYLRCPDCKGIGGFYDAEEGTEWRCEKCFEKNYIDWVICGAETGHGKRPMDIEWATNLRDQCQSAGVPFFFKKDSNGSRLLDNKLYEEYPDIGGK